MSKTKGKYTTVKTIDEISKSINNTFSVSSFYKFKADEIFKKAKERGHLVLTRYNKPIAVILTLEDFCKMTETIENAGIHLI